MFRVVSYFILIFLVAGCAKTYKPYKFYADREGRATEQTLPGTERLIKYQWSNKSKLDENEKFVHFTFLKKYQYDVKQTFNTWEEWRDYHKVNYVWATLSKERRNIKKNERVRTKTDTKSTKISYEAYIQFPSTKPIKIKEGYDDSLIITLEEIGNYVRDNNLDQASGDFNIIVKSSVWDWEIKQTYSISKSDLLGRELGFWDKSWKKSEQYLKREKIARWVNGLFDDRKVWYTLSWETFDTSSIYLPSNRKFSLSPDGCRLNIDFDYEYQRRSDETYKESGHIQFSTDLGKTYSHDIDYDNKIRPHFDCDIWEFGSSCVDVRITNMTRNRAAIDRYGRPHDYKYKTSFNSLDTKSGDGLMSDISLKRLFLNSSPIKYQFKHENAIKDLIGLCRPEIKEELY